MEEVTPPATLPAPVWRHLVSYKIDIRLLFLASIARTTGMNISVERQEIAN